MGMCGCSRVSLFQSRYCVIEINRAQTQNWCVAFFFYLIFFSRLPLVIYRSLFLSIAFYYCFPTFVAFFPLRSKTNHIVCHFSWLSRIEIHNTTKQQTQRTLFCFNATINAPLHSHRKHTICEEREKNVSVNFNDVESTFIRSPYLQMSKYHFGNWKRYTNTCIYSHSHTHANNRDTLLFCVREDRFVCDSPVIWNGIGILDLFLPRNCVQMWSFCLVLFFFG